MKKLNHIPVLIQNKKDVSAKWRTHMNYKPRIRIIFQAWQQSIDVTVLRTATMMVIA
jgi:hypothetical protein